MTENQQNLKIAFRSNNYSRKEELKSYQEQEVWSGDGIYKDESKLFSNLEFKATLIYNGFTRGRSSLNISWVDHERKLVYYSGMSLLDEALMQGFVEGNKITGTFCFKKQGTSILLQQIQVFRKKLKQKI